MYLRELTIISIVCLGLANPAKIPKLPKTLKRCHRNKPPEELNQCLQVAIEEAHIILKDGDPSINVDRIDPLTVPEIRIAQSNGPVNLKITQKNVTIAGTSKIQVKYINFDFNKKVMTGRFYTPKLVQTADQIIQGRILLFPISGEGKAVTITNGVSTNITGTFKEYEKNGYHYIKFDEKNFKYTLDSEKVEFQFENLFNGDKRLSAAMNRILNENWKLIFNEIKPTYELTLRKIMLNGHNRFFTKVPLEEIFLD